MSQVSHDLNSEANTEAPGWATQPYAQDGQRRPGPGWESDCSNGAEVLLWSRRTHQLFRVRARCQRVRVCAGCRTIMASRQVGVVAKACEEPCKGCDEPMADTLYLGRLTREEWNAARKLKSRLLASGGVLRERGRPSKADKKTVTVRRMERTPHASNCDDFLIDSLRVTHRGDERFTVVASADLAPASQRGPLRAVGLFTPYPVAEAVALVTGDLTRPSYWRRDASDRWKVKARNVKVAMAGHKRLAEAMRALGVTEGEAYTREEMIELATRINAALTEERP